MGDLQYIIDDIGVSRNYEYQQATDEYFKRIDERGDFYKNDRDLELVSLEDKGGMGESLNELEQRIEKIQGMLGEDVIDAMTELGRKGKKAKGLIESGT